jgi:hypothetical protein
MVKILQVKKLPIFDIFTGMGWDNHTRVIFNHENNSMKVIAGKPLQHRERNQAYKHLVKKYEKQ